MRTSDGIEEYITKLLAKSRMVELKRSAIAGLFNCVPSQINYVLTTRFTPEHGFIVESRRGGGGYIRITKVIMGKDGAGYMHVVNSIGDSLDSGTARAFLQYLYSEEMISAAEARIITAAISDQALSALPSGTREILRAEIMKRCLIAVKG